MIGKTYIALTNDTLGGSLAELITRLAGTDQKVNLSWVGPSQIAAGSKLEQNALLIYKDFILPLARCLGKEEPKFSISIEKTPIFTYHAHTHLVDDTSAGAALLVSMVSTLLRIPTSATTIVTASVDPPHQRLGVVGGLENKIKAVQNSNIETILIPRPQEQFEGTSERQRLQENYAQVPSVDHSSQKAETRFVSNVDDLWAELFPAGLVFEAVSANTALYDAIADGVSEQAPYYGLLGYLKGVLDRRWDILESCCKTEGLARRKVIFQSIVDFYVSNSVNPAHVYTNISRIHQSLQPHDGDDLLSMSNWAAFSRLYSLEQYDELLRLLLIAGKGNPGTDDTTDYHPLWTDQEFRERVREIIVSVTKEGDFLTLYQTLVVLVRLFTAERIMSFLRPDIYALLKSRFFDSWVTIYGDCCENWSDITKQAKSILDDPNQRIQEQAKVFRPFLQGMFNGVFFLRRLFHVDPALSYKLRRHGSFVALEQRWKTAKDMYERPDATPDDKIMAIVELELFKSIHLEILNYDDEIGSRITFDGEKTCLQPDTPTMTIEVNDDLSQLEFCVNEYAFEKFPKIPEIGVKGHNVISNPVLLWQESYNLPNYWKSDGFKRDQNELLALPDGHIVGRHDDGVETKHPGVIQKLFGESFVDISYQEVTVSWSSIFRWPPSIDSLFFIKTLKSHGYFWMNIQSVADIGSGSGFLGICLAKHNSNCNALFAVDVAASLKLLTEFNITKNLQDRIRSGLSSVAMTGSGLGAIEEFARFDLVICSPPYLPEREKYQPGLSLESPVDGTDLLEETIIKGRTSAREVVMQISEIALPEFNCAVERVGGKAQLLGSMDVPLRIPPISPYTPQELGVNPTSDDWEPALSHYRRLRNYTDMLATERNLITGNKRNYKYWHKLLVYSITY